MVQKCLKNLQLWSKTFSFVYLYLCNCIYIFVFGYSNVSRSTDGCWGVSVWRRTCQVLSPTRSAAGKYWFLDKEYHLTWHPVWEVWEGCHSFEEQTVSPFRWYSWPAGQIGGAFIEKTVFYFIQNSETPNFLIRKFWIGQGSPPVWRKIKTNIFLLIGKFWRRRIQLGVLCSLGWPFRC